MKRIVLAALAAGALLVAAPAVRQTGENNEWRKPAPAARSGNRMEGYLGFVAGGEISADLGGRCDQVKIRGPAV